MKNEQASAKFTCRVPRAMELLGYDSAPALYMACSRGQVPHRRHGKRLLFIESELIEFVKRQPGLTVEEALATR